MSCTEITDSSVSRIPTVNMFLKKFERLAKMQRCPRILDSPITNVTSENSPDSSIESMSLGRLG